MKVGIDTAPLNNQSAFRGVGRYTDNLLKALKGRQNIEIISGSWKNFWREVDLIHFPYFDFFFGTLPLFKKKPTIVTIHDCIPLVLSEHYPAGIKGKLKFYKQKISLKSVFSVITDSENSKKDVVRYLTVPEEKVSTIYLAPAPIYKRVKSTSILRRIEVKYKLPRNFILYIGDVNYNKNLHGLIKSMAKISPDYSLVLTGKAFENRRLPEAENIYKVIRDESLEDRIRILGFVPDEDLVLLYNLASVYCQPSFYEGFGLQILEAMACGCPVVTSTTSSLPEIAGKAAVLVDPYAPEGIAGAVGKVIKDGRLRSELIKSGFEQVKKFSWEKTAEETAKVYEKVLERQ